MLFTARKVLVVDDVSENRVVLGALLGYFGFDVTYATSGAEAIRLYEEDPSFDLVILNVEMSVVNGFTVIRMIRQYQKAKRPYVVGLASSPDNSDKAFGAGMDFFAIKPCETSTKPSNVFPFRKP